MAKEISLDQVSLSSSAVIAWKTICWRAARGLVTGVDPTQISDERVRLEDDGTLTIFVTLPSGGEVAMGVPVGHWAWAADPLNN